MEKARIWRYGEVSKISLYWQNKQNKKAHRDVSITTYKSTYCIVNESYWKSYQLSLQVLEKQ